MPSIHDREVVDGFTVEVAGYFPQIESALASLSRWPADAPALEQSHRLFHSIRGASRVVGCVELADLAAASEQLLEAVANGERAFDEQIARECQSSLAAMRGALDRFEHPRARAPKPEPEIDPELVEGFLLEAEEHFARIDKHLRGLDRATDRAGALGEIRRSVHTLKGSAGMVGFPEISQLAHRMEDLLDSLVERGQEYSADVHDLLSTTYDVLVDLAGLGTGAVENRAEALEILYSAYAEIVPPEDHEPGDHEPADVAPRAPASTSEAPLPEQVDPNKYVRVPLDRLRELVRLVGELLVNRSTFERSYARFQHETSEVNLVLKRLRRLSQRLDSDYATPALLRPVTLRTGQELVDPRADFDPLEMDRYTEFHLLARDLNETASDIGAAGHQLGGLLGDFDGYLTRLGRLTTELQDKLLALSMVPFQTQASRLHRTVRITGGKEGKPAELTIEGANVEFDKQVLEQLCGPLEHLLRNAVSHGIEDSDRRIALGKPETGNVLLRIAREGTEIVLRLSDDGAGIDAGRVREAAVRHGFLTAEQAAQATQTALYALLFQPGFTTAREVTDVSGRGIGLDVLRSTIESLSGSMSVDSTLGQGTSFTIRLPLSMAITKVLLVQAQGATFGVPLAPVQRITRVEQSELRRLGDVWTLNDGQDPLRLLELGSELGLCPAPRPEELTHRPVLVLRRGEQRYALMVDRIVEARDVVLKPLGKLTRKIPGIAASTLLGDGSVVLVLEPAELGAAAMGAQVQRRLTPAARRPLEVLIVDDSLSVRRVMANLFRGEGWQPREAKDGVEALEWLGRATDLPDVVLMDVEMPRMDGFELLASLRAHDTYKHLPVIMVTSRSGDKHRQKAVGLGVNDYLVKPFIEDTLLDLVRHWARRTS
ncbi:MAG: Hpt domain-containing protein [Bryobacteraceae bacterium]|nr:Hpt domain-containing protein [Bryobacteraceae bacterium]